MPLVQPVAVVTYRKSGIGVALGCVVRLSYVTETYPPELNGVAGTVARTVDWLRARGHGVDLVRPRQPREAFLDSADELRVPGVGLPMYRGLRFGLPMIGGLRRRWRQRRPEVVHIATEGPLGWAACRAARSLGLPVTSDLRTQFDLYSEYYNLGYLRRLVDAHLRRFHNATDLTFVPTAALARELRERSFRHVCVVGRGVDPDRFSPLHRSDALRRSWGAGPDDAVVLHVGRLAAEKNVGLVLRAFEAARQRSPLARLVVVGDGPLRRKLEREAGPAVLFVGEQRGERLSQHYASADIFLFPSLTETFGNVTLEALASGLVVVAYAVAAASVHVAHGVNGLLAQPGDEARFVDLTGRAVAELDRLQALRGLARRAAVASSWDAVLGQFEDKLLALRATAPMEEHAYVA